MNTLMSIYIWVYLMQLTDGMQLYQRNQKIDLCHCVISERSMEPDKVVRRYGVVVGGAGTKWGGCIQHPVVNVVNVKVFY